MQFNGGIRIFHLNLNLKCQSLVMPLSCVFIPNLFCSLISVLGLVENLFSATISPKLPEYFNSIYDGCHMGLLHLKSP
jgi:hypothetical protein